MYHISFCTAIKNRLPHFQQTLLQNIKDAASYCNVTFVVVDYNSSDGLESWVRSKLTNYIKCGKLVFYRTPVPAFFHRAHSRNLAFRLAAGDIVCNVDADNFIGQGFPEFINDRFSRNGAIYLSPGEGRNLKADFFGRICCRKQDYYRVGGYDEQMEGYGFEDHDLVNKLNALGLTQTGIPARFLSAIPHSDHDRVCEERLYKTLKCIYVSPISPHESGVIYLLKDGSYFHGTIVDRVARDSGNLESANLKPKDAHAFTVNGEKWATGYWSESHTEIVFGDFYGTASETRFSKKGPKQIIHEQMVYERLTNRQLLTELILFNSQFQNRTRMNQNLTSSEPARPHFGQGRVFKNFDYKIALDV